MFCFVTSPERKVHGGRKKMRVTVMLLMLFGRMFKTSRGSQPLVLRTFAYVMVNVPSSENAWVQAVLGSEPNRAPM